MKTQALKLKVTQSDWQARVRGYPYRVIEVMADELDTMMVDLIHSLYANCIINGVDDAALPAWKAHLEKIERVNRKGEAWTRSGESMVQDWNGSIAG